MKNLDSTLVGALKARGVELAAPLDCDDWAKLSSGLSPRFARNLEKIYTHFNGFIVSDHKSQIRLWSVSEVIEKNREMNSTKFDSIFCIGDFLIESDYILFESVNSKISFEGDRSVIYNGITDFIQHLVEGDFDFL